VTKEKNEAAQENPGYQKPEAKPYPLRHRVAITFPDDGRTRGSFKDECDIDRIVSRFLNTGALPHQQRRPPQYGDAPDATLFEAAVTHAELRSLEEEGVLAEYENAQQTASEAVSGDPEADPSGEPSGEPADPPPTEGD
jgi:hypothetical protein